MKLETVMYGDVAAKTGPPPLAGNTTRVCGGLIYFVTILEKMDDDDICFYTGANQQPIKTLKGSKTVF